MNTQNAVDQAMNLLAIASPTGYTANVTDWLLNQLTEMGFAPTRTRKGCVVCTLGGVDWALLCWEAPPARPWRRKM